MERLTANEEKLNLMYKGWQDFSNNLLKPSKEEKELKELPIKLKKGSIRYRADLGVFETRIQINKIRKSIYSKNKIECIKKTNKLYNNTYKKLNFKIELEEQKEHKLHYLLDYWMKNYKVDDIKNQSTLNAMQSILNRFVKTKLVDKDVNKITVIELDQFIDSLPPTRTKETICMMLNDFFKFLFNKEILKKQLHGKFKKYKHERKEGHFLTKEQRVIFLNSIRKIKLRNFYKFIYYTGVRRHGALNLCYEDIDFKNETIHIRETKTAGSDRIIPLNKHIKKILQNGGTGKVFKISDRQIKQSLKELEQLCGFKVLIKDLRTTFTTICNEKGINTEVIAKWLGHTSTNTTKKYYIKIDTAFEKEQSKLL